MSPRGMKGDLAARGGDTLPCRHQAGVVLSSGWIFNIALKMREGGRIGESRLTQQCQMSVDFETPRLVGPGGVAGFDEVAIHENPAFWEYFMTARVYIGHGPLAAEVV